MCVILWRWYRLYQSDRRPLTSLATFSSYLHSEKSSSLENSLTSVCGTAGDHASSLRLDRSRPYGTADQSRVFSPLQPFTGPVEQSVRSQNLDIVRPGQWLTAEEEDTCQQVECSFDCVDYRTVGDTQYLQPGAYQTPADWTAAGYQSMTTGHSEVKVGKDHVAACSQPSANMIDSCQLIDDESSGVTAKKIKQVRAARTEHGRRTTHVASSRRASTGSLLHASTQDHVSFSLYWTCQSITVISQWCLFQTCD